MLKGELEEGQQQGLAREPHWAARGPTAPLCTASFAMELRSMGWQLGHSAAAGTVVPAAEQEAVRRVLPRLVQRLVRKVEQEVAREAEQKVEEEVAREAEQKVERATPHSHSAPMKGGRWGSRQHLQQPALSFLPHPAAPKARSRAGAPTLVAGRPQHEALCNATASAVER